METEGAGGAFIAGGATGAIIAAIGNVGIPNGILTSGIFAIVGTVVWIAYSTLVAKEKAAKAREEHLNEVRERERRERQEARDSAFQMAKSCAAESVAAFGRMSELVEEVDARIRQARRRRDDGAFSPYWSAIEQAYDAAGEYTDCVAVIEAHSRSYGSAVARYVELGGDPKPFARFPVTFGDGVAESVLKARLDVLEAMVYDAQRDPTFADIWEQRQTRKAIIGGFRNLEAAVDNMGRSLQASFEALSGTSSQSQAVVSAAVRRTSVPLAGANPSLSAEMATLWRTAGMIHEKMTHQRRLP